MSEIHSGQFTTISYVTKDGERCTATKNNGIVTVQGDKNGIRQVPVEQFMKELVATLPKVDLVRTPGQDTVQFKGGEEKAGVNATENTTADEKPNHKVRNWAIGIGSTVAAVVGLGLLGRGGHLGKGIQKFLGGAEKDAGKIVDDVAGAAGHTNPHVATETSEISAQEFEQIVNREADFVYGGRKAAEEAANSAQTKVSGEAGEVIKAEEAATTGTPKPAETSVAKPIETAPKPNASESTVLDVRPKSPIPQSELLELPKDLELDPAKVLTGNNVGAISYKNSEIVVSMHRNNGILRTYVLTPDKTKITCVREYSTNEIRPFRIIEFKDGVPHAIRDNTVVGDRVRFLPKEKSLNVAPKPAETVAAPAAKPKVTEKTKENELDRIQREQDEIIRQQEQEAERLRLQREREAVDNMNTDIINAAVISEAIGRNAANTTKAAEQAEQALAENIAKTAERALGHSEQNVAEAAARTELPKVDATHKAENVVNDAVSVKPESVLENGEKAADDLFAGTPKITEPADGFHASSDFIETPKISTIDDIYEDVSFPKSMSYEDDLARIEANIDNTLDNTTIRQDFYEPDIHIDGPDSFFDGIM